MRILSHSLTLFCVLVGIGDCIWRDLVYYDVGEVLSREEFASWREFHPEIVEKIEGHVLLSNG